VNGSRLLDVPLWSFQCFWKIVAITNVSEFWVSPSCVIKQPWLWWRRKACVRVINCFPVPDTPASQGLESNVATPSHYACRECAKEFNSAANLLQHIQCTHGANSTNSRDARCVACWNSLFRALTSWNRTQQFTERYSVAVIRDQAELFFSTLFFWNVFNRSFCEINAMILHGMGPLRSLALTL